VEQIKQLLATKTIAMNADMRRQLLKMGVKSENFCRQAISGLDKNRQVVPPSLGLDEALLDLRALESCGRCCWIWSNWWSACATPKPRWAAT